MGVELEIFVVANRSIYLQSRVGRVSGMYPSPEGGVDLGDIESTVEVKENPDDYELKYADHPAGFYTEVFEGEFSNLFNPYKTIDSYGCKSVITKIAHTVEHFNKMIETNPLWKKHIGFMRTKAMLELFPIAFVKSWSIETHQYYDKWSRQYDDKWIYDYILPLQRMTSNFCNY